MEPFIPKPADETAEFNNAFAFLERLNRIEYMIEDSLMNWNLRGAFAVLESYENELCFSFKGKEQEEVDAIKNKIINIFNGTPNIGSVSKDVTGKKCIAGSSMTGELRLLIIELNKKLRGIKHKRGMGMPTRGEGKLF
jgi:hypothetical protein